MGNSDSRLGYRIMEIKENSPASRTSVEPMLDFLLYPPPDAKGECPAFSEYVTRNENKEIELTFYNIATRQVRKCKITPSKWEGEGLLGFEINQEDYLVAHNRVIRILDFFLESPLYKGGFNPKTDYILGTEKFVFDDAGEFTSFIQKNNKKPIDLLVYSSKDEKVRKLTLKPDSEWGGVGYLGGDIGFGYIHSLPIRDQAVDEDNKKEGEREGVEENTVVTEISSGSLGVNESDILVGGNGIKVNES